MKKKILLTIGLVAVALAGTGAVLYATNPAPVVATLNPADPAVAARPYVIKIHAKWCPVCMVTKGRWSQLEAKYQGKVNFVVFDVTNEATTAASAAEAKRLGLDAFFEDRSAATGYIAVLEAGTKKEHAFLGGGSEPQDYFNAVDAVLAGAAPAGRGN